MNKILYLIVTLFIIASCNGKNVSDNVEQDPIYKAQKIEVDGNITTYDNDEGESTSLSGIDFK